MDTSVNPDLSLNVSAACDISTESVRQWHEDAEPENHMAANDSSSFIAKLNS